MSAHLKKIVRMVVDKPVDYLCIKALGGTFFRPTKALFYRDFLGLGRSGRVGDEC
jgi:hypothetical protein